MARYIQSNGKHIDTSTATEKELERFYRLHPQYKPSEPEKPKKVKKEVIEPIEKEGG